MVAPSLDADVAIEVTGLLARVRVRQTFTNPGEDWTEAVYVFPLPEDAAVDHMRIEIGEQVIEGEIKERVQAEKIYQKARQSGQRTSLLRQERPNLFTTRVANIGPGEVLAVEIEYQQAVQYQQSAGGESEYRLRFPMTITPRYIPGSILRDEMDLAQAEEGASSADTDQVQDDSRISPPVGNQGFNNTPTKITLDIHPGFELAALDSPSHQVQRDQIQPGHYRIRLPAGKHPANADFRLQWQAEEKAETQTALFVERWQGDLYGLLMLTPPAATGIGTLVPRDVIFILDTSGSMGGEPLRQAKLALSKAIDGLDESDRFNLIEFNSVYRQLWGAMRPADAAHRDQANSFIDRLVSRGGTEMAAPLRAALCDQCVDEGRLRQIIFITDGAVGNEATLFNTIERRLGASRLFTVGIGSAPNSFFMRKAAQTGRGAYTFIAAPDQVDKAMTEMLQKLRYPALTDIRLAIDGDSSDSISPWPVPDLYQGEPLLLAMKLDAVPGSIEVTGRRGSEQVRAQVTVTAEERSGIHVLWARQHIEALHNHFRASPGSADKEQTRQGIVDLALEHHLVSPFTSIVAVEREPATPLGRHLQKHSVANNPPAGTRFGLAATATPATVYLLAGLLLALCGLSMRVVLRGRWQC